MGNDNAGGGVRGLRSEVSEPLLNAVRKAYGIDFEGKPVDLGGSSSLNLQLTNRTNRWVLRVYRPYVTAERLEAIHLVRRELTLAGVPCEGLVRTVDGAEWISFENRLVELERYIERDADMNTETLALGMPVLARMHAILENVSIHKDGSHPLFANYLAPEQVLSQTLRGTRRIRGWHPSPLELEAADQADLLARRVTSAACALREMLPKQLVHGDFWDNNVFLREGKVVFVADFDFMGERLRIDDLALTLYFTCMDFTQIPITDEQITRLRGLLDAYDCGADRPLTANERSVLPLMIARQPLWSIGGWVAQLDDEGAARAHAAATAPEVKWALQMMDEIDRWQKAFE